MSGRLLTGRLLTLRQILTGATGSIGAHALVELAARESIDTVYCFVRGSTDPMKRITESLQRRSLSLGPAQSRKVVPFRANLCAERFDLAASPYHELLARVTTIVHAAWPVNFALPLRSFEPDLSGLQNLLAFSLHTHRGTAKLLFCSSVSTAFQMPKPCVIAEEPIENYLSASKLGYARSKLVGEQIVLSTNERYGTSAQILRIGQVVGDTQHGVWNDSEAVPLMIRSALTVGALPLLDEQQTWLPVDVLGRTIAEISEQGNQQIRQNPVLNVVSPRTFGWSALLEKLRSAGLEFETLRLSDWIGRMEASERRGEEVTNPGVKLLDHYRSLQGDDPPPPRRNDETAKTSQHLSRELSFATAKAESLSAALKCAPNVIEGDCVALLLSVWMTRWKAQMA